VTSQLQDKNPHPFITIFLSMPLKNIAAAQFISLSLKQLTLAERRLG